MCFKTVLMSVGALFLLSPVFVWQTCMCLQCWSVLEVLWSLWRVMFLRREQETEMERREEERVVLIGLCTAPSMRVISFFFSACPASFSLSSHRSTLHFSVCHSVFLCRAFFFLRVCLLSSPFLAWSLLFTSSCPITYGSVTFLLFVVWLTLLAFNNTLWQNKVKH